MEDNEEKCKIIEDVSNKLQLSIKSFKASYHGFTVCERIRDYVSCPIIFLTARIEDSDKIKLLNIVCKNIEFYINQWDDIKHFNSVSFSPQKFYLAEKGIG